MEYGVADDHEQELEIVADSMTVSPEEAQPSKNSKLEFETESAKCDCCGLTEEYTKLYIERARQRYNGTWICGLCSEAIEDEIVRSGRLLTTDEAMKMHMSFCGSFNSAGPPPNPAVHLIAAMRQILRRGALRSLPGSPTRERVPLKKLMRSESCFLPIADEQDDECKVGCL